MKSIWKIFYRAPRLGSSACIAVAFAALALLTVASATASAAPMTEVEPNESSVAANGPIPADGFLSTISTTNDSDYAFINLKAQQQVTISLTGQTTQCSVSRTDLSATDWLGRVRMGHSLSSYELNKGTYLWTTPEVPVRLNVGDFYSNVGCRTLFKVEPATAILNEALPAIPPRTLSVAAPNAIVASLTSNVVVSGDAFDADKAKATLEPLSVGTCPAAGDYPSDSDSTATSWTAALPTGPFTASLPVSAVSPGNYLVCAWMVNPASEITTIVTSQRVNVVPRGRAILVKKTVRRGERLRARIKNVKGFVEFRFTRKGKQVANIRARVYRGKAAVSTRKLPTGTFRLKIYGGDQKLVTTTIRVVH